MGHIVHEESGKVYPLAPSFIIGRAAKNCNLVITNHHTSGSHAEIRYARNMWTIHDLGSSNGTYIDQRRILPGVHEPLTLGMKLAFGDPKNQFVFADDTPPAASAVCGDESVDAVDGLLVVPDSSAADHITIYHDEDRGCWLAQSHDGHTRKIADGEVLTIGSRQWRLQLPMIPEHTRQLGDEPLRCRALTVRSRASADGAHVTIELVHRGRVIETEWRNNVRARLLHRMVDARASDQREGHASEAQEGWLDIDEVLDAFGRNRGWLDVTICRIRQQFAALGVVDSVTAIERRRPTQFRLGIAAVEVVPA